MSAISTLQLYFYYKVQIYQGFLIGRSADPRGSIKPHILLLIFLKPYEITEITVCKESHASAYPPPSLGSTTTCITTK